MSENYRNYLRTFCVELLSLDLSSYFVDELDLSAFYSLDLRDIARAIVRSKGFYTGFDEYVCAMHAMPPDTLTEAVSAELGRSVGSAVAKWQSRLPDQETNALTFQWRTRLAELVAQWDAAIEDKLPLCRHHDAPLRSRIRDYVGRSISRSQEVWRVYGSYHSEWDTAMDDLRGEDTAFVPTCVTSASESMHACRFWPDFVEAAQNGQLDELLAWARLKAYPSLFAD